MAVGTFDTDWKEEYDKERINRHEIIHNLHLSCHSFLLSADTLLRHKTDIQKLRSCRNYRNKNPYCNQ